MELGIKVLLPLIDVRAFAYDARIHSFSEPQGSYGPRYTFEGSRDRGFSVAIDFVVGGYFVRDNGSL
ncbi:MAG: hypothetical protein AABY13_01050, partial [Nanoarchaeota archaeon]